MFVTLGGGGGHTRLETSLPPAREAQQRVALRFCRGMSQGKPMNPRRLSLCVGLAWLASFGCGNDEHGSRGLGGAGSGAPPNSADSGAGGDSGASSGEGGAESGASSSGGSAAAINDAGFRSGLTATRLGERPSRLQLHR